MLRRRVINPLALISLLTLAVLAFFIPLPWWSFAIVIIVWFFITVCGSFFVGWNYHLKSLHSNKKSGDNWVSLTFDDGPNPEFTPKVLKLLKEHGAKATFFCIGQHVENHPDILKQILAAGHSVGNHTYSHSKSFGFFGFQKVKAELQKTKSIVNHLTGLKMNLYRPAFGVTNPQIEKAVKTLGLRSIGWSVRSLDTTPRSENSVWARITSKVAKGDIILLHDTSEKTIAVLERLLVFLQEENLQSVTVERLLEIEAYE
ncbi:polysaccharide deacetylase family protein [Pricia sp.]|uniref:polysaccharide deacetylase family protein n=1 Tax=Pricia sp. TaxID=2268138 RepID=UPI0035945EB5